MTATLIIVGGVLGFIALVFIVGSLLPATYDAEVVLNISRPPGDIWARLEDCQSHPIAGRMARDVQSLPDHNGMTCWAEDLGASIITVRTVESTLRAHVVREMRDSIVPMTSRLEVALEPAGEGCRVIARQTTVIRLGTWHSPIFRLMMTLFGGARRPLRDYLSRIARSLGEKPAFG